MNKFILGGILAAICLMAIYGTSASDQVISKVDGGNSTSSQTNFGQPGTADDDSVVALNATETNNTEANGFTELSAQTPLEKAGTIPQRQTIGATANFDDTDGVAVEAPDPAAQPPATPGGNTTPTTPPATPAPAQTPAPIRALW